MSVIVTAVTAMLRLLLRLQSVKTLDSIGLLRLLRVFTPRGPPTDLKPLFAASFVNGSVLSIIVLTGVQALSPLGHGEKTAHSISRGDLPRHEPRGSA